jgi:tRNA uridine 5-carboxymethylaminomethyl modification enzyme
MNVDVVVIGGGHAGIEAAWAASRLGATTALVTISIDAIGRMSCNPAIGGIGKGQIVREIDSMGGLMGQITDQAGIQYRLLNRSKGPAVWSPRAQADRKIYSDIARDRLQHAPNLNIVEGMVAEILCTEHDSRQRIRGVRLEDGRTIAASAVVLAAGTFLRGLLHFGPDQQRGGRVDEPPSDNLSRSLESLGLRLGRLKTGTPPRLDCDSIDYSVLAKQLGDEPPLPFSFLTDRIDRPQIPCWITWTNAATHQAIRDNLHRAPLFTGQIQSRGPRYCPSIEDKTVRFPDKDRHQVFLEPEGIDSDRVYCNGLPTSLPIDVQQAMVHSIAGLENARILQFGYAVEYDWVPTDQITAWLEAKAVDGLFLAGQINGTSGYEEAAAQGMIAGINAAMKLAGREPLILGRDQAYIGVMIDDLVTRPPTEPYRMFTSRAEYRLHLRSDNADTRLTPIGRSVGTVDDARWVAFQAKQSQIAALNELLGSIRHEGKTLTEWLRRPEMTLASVLAMLPASEGTGDTSPSGRVPWSCAVAGPCSSGATPAAFAGVQPEAPGATGNWPDSGAGGHRPPCTPSGATGGTSTGCHAPAPLQEHALSVPASASGGPPSPATIMHQAREQVEIAIKYAGYLVREQRQIEKFAELERWKIAASFDYAAVAHLRFEAREKLAAHQPISLGQALRISGITPADLTVLMVHLEAQRRRMSTS